MSAWVIALGLSAGYLVNKNLQMTERLEQQVKVHQEEAKPADPGPTSEAIRTVQRTVPDGGPTATSSQSLAAGCTPARASH